MALSAAVLSLSRARGPPPMAEGPLDGLGEEEEDIGQGYLDGWLYVAQYSVEGRTFSGACRSSWPFVDEIATWILSD